MKKVIVVGRVAALFTGTLSLTAEQAKTRMHCLRQDGEDFQIVQPVQFITGEEFGYDGELSADLALAGVAEEETPKAEEPAPVVPKPRGRGAAR